MDRTFIFLTIKPRVSELGQSESVSNESRGGFVNGQAVTLDVYPYTGECRMIEYFNDNPNEELARDSDRKLSGK